ncbi:MAG: hypothetical protein WD934_02655 [Gemmatimonadales bacterium]
MTIALVTAAALPGLFPDDRILLHALRHRGHAAEPVIWEDQRYPWADAEAVVIRSAWDYSWRRPAFLAWADAVPRGRLWNAASVVRWNTHKRYLLDLAERGVSVIPTVLVPAGSGANLAAVMSDRDWPDAVLKPAVGQSGRYTQRVRPDDRVAGQAFLDRLLPTEDMLVQRFVPGIGETGEMSLTYFDGTFSHAVRKRAAAGDFRVHDDYGGTVEREAPSAAELRAAEAALEAVDGDLLYARVDLVRGPDGKPTVMELELVEPELFFAHAPESAVRMADAIRARC